jgi:hypothetical protein
MSERRYNETEVAAIFEQAAKAQQMAQRQSSSGEGMTLAELQEIGREVGLAPELVVRAARAIDQGGRPTSRRFFGLPIGVGRTIDLDRRLSDEEWDRLVVDLRETFDARGTIRQEGSLRAWTNGNLQALLEPTPTGHRIRLRTLKGDAQRLMTGGIAMSAVGIVVFVAGMLSGGAIDPGNLSTFGILAAMGVGVFGLGALRIPGWARRRRQQMAEIASRLMYPDPQHDGL